MVVIIDNYDSFTYNLYQYIGQITNDVKVIRNDKETADGIIKKGPSHIVISPGPGYPAQAGISIDTVKKAGCKIPILGVCLGHQAVVEAYGGKIVHAKELVHGKASMIKVDSGCILFEGMPERIMAGRYHSLAADKRLPECLKITAKTDDGEIMGIEHRKYPVYGIQFHPESVLTDYGMKLLENFLSKT